MLMLPPKVFSRILARVERGFSTVLNYSPPESKLGEFTKLIYQLEDQQSNRQAAELMATIEADREIYEKLLISTQQEYEKIKGEYPDLARAIENRKTLEALINEKAEENERITKRLHRQMDSIKVYAVTRLAKELVEKADHLTQALHTLSKSSLAKDKNICSNLQILSLDFRNILRKFEVEEFDPKEEPFNPNWHLSLDSVPSSDSSKINVVAETKITGWKVKDRLLRHATVLIYK